MLMSVDPLDTVCQKLGDFKIKNGGSSHLENLKIAISLPWIDQF